MKKSTLILGMALIAASGMANAEMHDMSQQPMPMMHDMSQQQMAAQPAEQVKHEGHGILKAVNEKAHKVQIAHEVIASLHWPAMTMWFALGTPLPKDLKSGDSISFELQQIHSKKWTVTHIEKK